MVLGEALLRQGRGASRGLLRAYHASAGPLAAEPEPVPLSKLKDSFNDATSVTYLEELEKRYLDDPSSVDRTWASFFKSLGAVMRCAVPPLRAFAPLAACDPTKPGCHLQLGSWAPGCPAQLRPRLKGQAGATRAQPPCAVAPSRQLARPPPSRGPAPARPRPRAHPHPSAPPMHRVRRAGRGDR
jgi:hypothetical protein